jgi:hypothetical protein
MPVDRDHSIFAQQFNIPSTASDISQWDCAWERLLPTLSISDVFPVISRKWLRILNPHPIDDYGERFFRSEELVMKLWDELTEKNTIFVHVWLLLKEEDCKRHVLNGIKEACDYAILGQDVRALCPEITTSALLKHDGWGFVQLAHNCADGVKRAGVRAGIAVLWSDWFARAAILPAGETINPHTQLSVQRDLFIGE